MKHTPKPDGTRWMKRNGSVSGPLEETGYQEACCLTDGHLKWTRDGHFNASRSQHSFDLLYPVTVTPLPDPEPEEPKLPKEAWVQWFKDGSCLAYATEGEADTDEGDVVRYVLPDEAGLTFSEEEIEIGVIAYLSTPPDRPAFRAALDAISQHRSKKPS